ncbi:carboxypeptidase-like regulatory domain-containing protein [Hymenobacter endophyticus]|uniref:Carboxypeptidase-like regulatory domain-containing protein n=1 Tax=Hymenobacter endophyticus TaxID=3076335 RepID=A0ABU3TID8_9BACT|nr:carboxypeptidase-like regulatory domain-containing protein [Hymenobacter endophyticus]MDU0371132.1 carboxypeptidase-like regulatory domain-containing protein [Hymenobacter endophyticus]
MKYLRFYLLTALFFGGLPTAFAQFTLVGQVQVQGTQQPLPFVNIGIRGKNTGTVADADGSFQLRVPIERQLDTLTFSAVGYQEQAWPLVQLRSRHPLIIRLVEKPTLLREVVIRAKQPKTRRIGTTTHNPFLWGQVQRKDSHDMVEFAKLIPLAGKPTELLQAHIFLRYPTEDSLTFRLNFYRADQDLPTTRLVEQALVVRTAVKNGWLTIELAPYALALQTDFYLGFEFLPGKSASVPSFSYGGQFGGSAVSRTSSLGTWKREPGASLSAYVTVRQ